jgi:hypothetical protein
VNLGRRALTRRQMFAFIGFAVVAAGAARFVLPYLKGAQRTGDGRENAVASLAGVDDHQSLATIVEFTAGLFGHNLSEQDRQELIDRLRYATSIDASFSEDYAELARHADRLSAAQGARSFQRASDTQRQVVIDHFMNIDTHGLFARLLSHVSKSQSQHYRTRWRTIPHLIFVYRHSGVPWRARGYRRWPGIPGVWTEYLSAGPQYPSNG